MVGVEAREAPERFLDEQLSTLRVLAMTSESIVPARLYLGIENCFRGSAQEGERVLRDAGLTASAPR